MYPKRLIRDPRTIAGLLHSNRRDVHKDTVVKLRQDTQLTKFLVQFMLYVPMFPCMYVWGHLRFATALAITYKDYTPVKIPMFLLWWSKLQRDFCFWENNLGWRGNAVSGPIPKVAHLNWRGSLCFCFTKLIFPNKHFKFWQEGRRRGGCINFGTRIPECKEGG